tara:strand:+ start:63 stop:350 length:288 start_codon:yes stop_codon:yes gene_type:complete
MGSVNHSFAISSDQREKLKKYGKHYASIDFEMNNDLFEDEIMSSSEKKTIGKLVFSNASGIDLTYSECVRVIQTLTDALDTHNKMYKLGAFKKRN